MFKRIFSLGFKMSNTLSSKQCKNPQMDGQRVLLVVLKIQYFLVFGTWILKERERSTNGRSSTTQDEMLILFCSILFCFKQEIIEPFLSSTSESTSERSTRNLGGFHSLLLFQNHFTHLFSSKSLKNRWKLCKPDASTALF